MLSFIPSLQKATWHTKMHWHKKNIDTTEKNTILKRYTHTHTQHARESQPWQADIKQLDLCYVPNTDPTGQNTCLCLFVCLSSWTLYVCDGGRKWNKANSVTFATLQDFWRLFRMSRQIDIVFPEKQKSISTTKTGSAVGLFCHWSWESVV